MAELTITDKKDHSTARTIITSLRVKQNPRHWHITVWNRGGQAGILVVDAVDGPHICNALIPLNRQNIKEMP
jgi:hypothetical protein